jgi:serine phosphatase RsbU (regulator of sigma subunit)
MLMEFPLEARVLVIDDDAQLRKEIKDYLEDTGFVILEAKNGKEGLDIFKQEKPDLVVSDLQMPVMSGLEVLRTITKDSPETPIVAISEPGGLDDVISALRIGAWDYLTKPIAQLPVLEHAICRALERSRLIQENRIYRQKLELANQELKKSLDTLEEDQEAGRSVQSKMLPEQNVNYEGYVFSHSISPSLYLSGDLTDYVQISEGCIGFYIADVSGHGSSSAFVTVLLKSIVAQILTQYTATGDKLILHPEQLLAKIAEEIYIARLGKYLTMVYGVIDVKNNELNFSMGGHYPMPLLLEDKKARFIGSKSFPIGIMKKTAYQRETVKFKEGFKLILFSDGIAELLPGKDMEEKEKMLLSLAEFGDGSIDYIVSQLDLEGKKNLPDDVTMLALKKVST